MKNFVFTLVSLASMTLVSSATPIWSESFSYSSGSLTNVSGSLWTSYSGSGNAIQVSGGKVTGMIATSVSSQDSERLLDTSYSSGTLYAGFDLTLSTTPVGSAYFAHFKDATTSGFRSRIFLGAPTSTGFRLGLENDGGDNGGTTAFSTDLTLGVTYRVVLAYDVTARTSKLWINSSDEGTPTVVDAVAPGTALTIASFALRQGGSATATYTGLDIDNLNVSTEFLTAYTVPEPSTMVLAGIGLAALFIFRRRRD